MDEARAQEEINKYRKFRKVDGATYRKVNQFLRKRTYITAREWALARLCTDFRTTNGAEMTFIGEHLPQLVPFMEEKYSPQAVNQARNSFKKKVRKSSATFFYGAMCGFFTTEELDDLLFEASEVARFLLEVESTTLDIDEEIDIEDRISGVMRSVGEAAKTILKTRVMEAKPLPGPAGDTGPAVPGDETLATQVRGKRARSRRKRAAAAREEAAGEGAATLRQASTDEGAPAPEEETAGVPREADPGSLQAGIPPGDAATEPMPQSPPEPAPPAVVEEGSLPRAIPDTELPGANGKKSDPAAGRKEDAV